VIGVTELTRGSSDGRRQDDAGIHRPARDQRGEPGGPTAPAAACRPAQGGPAGFAGRPPGRGQQDADARRRCATSAPASAYKLRDAAGQAREFNNYMLPVDLGDGVPVFLFGMRDTPAEAFRYLRVPADDKGSTDGFLRLRAALNDAALRDKAVQSYARQATDPEPAGADAATRRLHRPRAGAVRRRRSGGRARRPAACRRSRVRRSQRARRRALARRRGAGAHPERRAVRAGAGEPPAGRPAAAAARRKDPGLHDAGRAGAERCLRLSGADGLPAAGLQAGAGQRVPGDAFAGPLHRVSGLRLADPGGFRHAVCSGTPALGLAQPARAGSQARMALSSNRKLLDVDREFDRLRTASWESSHEHRHDHHHHDHPLRGLLLEAPLRLRLAVRAAVAAGGLFVFARYGQHMDVYEKGILLAAIPAAIWLGWFWRRCAC
jgi:hypothetical protein